MFQRASTGLVAGIVAGLLVVAPYLITDTQMGNSGPHLVQYQPSAASAAAFVATWKRMREGTWVTDSTFTRTTTDGRSFSSALHDAQRPPLRTRVNVGTTTYELTDRTVICTVKKDNEQPSCRNTPPGGTFQALADKDLVAVKRLVEGDVPAYTVGRSDGDCFVLIAGATQAVSTWGSRAEFCFDSKTGAISHSRIQRGTATDVVDAQSIKDDVPDSEFAPPAGGAVT